MGKLADAIRAEHANRHRSQCRVAAVLRELKPDLRADLIEMLADSDNASGPEISRGLKATAGVNLGTASIGRHRRGDCVCPR